MSWRKLANGEIFSLHLSDGSMVIKPAHLFSLNAEGGGNIRNRIISFSGAARVAKAHQACVSCMLMKKKESGRAGSFITSLRFLKRRALVQTTAL